MCCDIPCTSEDEVSIRGIELPPTSYYFLLIFAVCIYRITNDKTFRQIRLRIKLWPFAYVPFPLEHKKAIVIQFWAFYNAPSIFYSRWHRPIETPCRLLPTENHPSHLATFRSCLLQHQIPGLIVQVVTVLSPRGRGQGGVLYISHIGNSFSYLLSFLEVHMQLGFRMDKLPNSAVKFKMSVYSSF